MKYDYLYLIQKHFKNFPKNKAAQNVLKLICPEDLEYQIATINHSKLLIQFVEGKNEIKKEISISKIGEENLETVKSFCLVWDEKKDISYFFTEIVSPLKNDQAQYSYLEEVVTKDMQIQKAITAIVGEDLKAEKITMGYWIYKYQNLPSDICNKVTDILDDNFSSDYVAECLNKEKKIKEETGFLPDFCKIIECPFTRYTLKNDINDLWHRLFEQDGATEEFTSLIDPNIISMNLHMNSLYSSSLYNTAINNREKKNTYLKKKVD